MDEIDKLCELLNELFPVSLEFRATLRKVLMYVNKDHLKILLRIGQRVKHAWQLLSGFVVSIRVDPDGTETVVWIYFPGDLFTDLPGFLEGQYCKYKLRAVGDIRLLQIDQEGFKKLTVFSETPSLVQKVLMMREETAMTRGDLFCHSPDERVAIFLETLPAENLPATYAASFLGITELSYVAGKTEFYRKKYLRMPLIAADNRVKQQLDIAHMARAYILGNFHRQDLGTTKNIADACFTTPKTLSRAVFACFNQTVPDMIADARLQRALVLLKDTDLLVPGVAFTVGFNTLKTFKHLFKRKFGFLPKKGLKIP